MIIKLPSWREALRWLLNVCDCKSVSIVYPSKSADSNSTIKACCQCKKHHILKSINGEYHGHITKKTSKKKTIKKKTTRS